MIDLHSHILYGIDDGATDMQMTLEMLKIAEKDGITTMVATPHYIVGANQYDQDDLKRRYHEVVDCIKRNSINIELLLGNELYLDEYILESLEQDECYSMGGTRYVLLELPMLGIPIYTEKVFYDLINKKYKPILAHPERYIPVQEDPNILIDYINMGCIIQVNSSSINGISGGKSRETARLLLENNMAHLIATDCHSNGRRQPQLSMAYMQVVSWIGKEKSNNLFFINPRKVLKNEDIDIGEPLYFRKKREFLNVLRNYFMATK